MQRFLSYLAHLTHRILPDPAKTGQYLKLRKTVTIEKPVRFWPAEAASLLAAY